jgi:hypothetical protein
MPAGEDGEGEASHAASPTHNDPDDAFPDRVMHLDVHIVCAVQLTRSFLTFIGFGQLLYTVETSACLE